MNETIDKHYQKSPSVVARKVAGEIILVPITQNIGELQCIYTLNGVSAYIWELLDDCAVLKDLVSKMVIQYNVESQQAQEDLIEFLGQLESIGAVTSL